MKNQKPIKKRTAIDWFKIDISHFSSFVHILKITSDVPNFRRWLKNYHSIRNDDELFLGYQFFIDVVLNNIFDGLDDPAFNLKSDRILDRAEWTGVPIDEIPNSSEKIIVFKNLWNSFKKIRNVENWDNLNQVLIDEISPILSIFDRIFKKYTNTRNKISKSEALRLSSMNYTLIFLNDTYRGYPNSYPFIMLGTFISENNFDKVYLGYAYAVEYLWYLLLGESDFEKLPVKELHKAHKTYFEEEINDDEHDFYPIDFDEREFTTRVYWDCFDRFFSIINEEIIERLTPKIGRIGSLTISKKFDKQIFGGLLEKKGLAEPDYLTKEDSKDNTIKKINYYLYWYDADYLDSDITIIGGVPAFTSVLLGEIQKYSFFKVEEKVEVLRIKHPAGENKFDYSYGVFFELPVSLFSDHSGWLIFLRCGTDYSGTGGYYHETAEKFISICNDNGQVNVRELIVDLGIFKEFLKKDKLRYYMPEIYEAAEYLWQDSEFSPQSWFAFSTLQKIQRFNVNDMSILDGQIENLVFSLKANIPNIPENKVIIDKIDGIQGKDSTYEKFGVISTIIQLLPKIYLDKRISEKFERFESQLNEIRVCYNPRIEEKLVIKSGLSVFGSGLEHTIEIPIQDISYPAIKEDLEKLGINRLTKLKELPTKLKNRIIPFVMDKIKRED
ncbi:MAG: hypothetical protein ABSD81_04520 [Methanomicrobiales archaeon]|jgi:hypothetical protein